MKAIFNDFLSMNRKSISFVLVEPAVAGNIGASARAMKTMGFERMALVNPRARLDGEAEWLAHGSASVLKNAIIYGSLKEAVEGFDLVIGTSAKPRRTSSDYYPCGKLPQFLSSKTGMAEKIAVVFGREESGLTNEEARLCNILSSIPMAAEYPSLNLSQAVMIYAYILSGIPGREQNPETATFPSDAKYRYLRSEVAGLLDSAGFDPGSAVYNRIMERLEALGDKDAGLILSFCRRLSDKPGN